MIYLIQYIYISAFILGCISLENENVPPMAGFYTEGLDQALDKIEIVYPEKVSKDGSFVSYYLPHYYNLESLESRPKRTADDSNEDSIHFFIPIEGEKHHLELWPNLNFLAPGLVIERRDARDVENINKAKISQISQKQCHYNGRIVGKPESRAALSTCYGLAGYIQLPAGEEYLIEPVKDSKPTYNKGSPHIIYKRSGMKDHHGNSNCLTKGTAKDALGERLQWEEIFGNQVQKDFAAVNMNDLVRDNIGKTFKDSSKSMNPSVSAYPPVSLPQEKLVKESEDNVEEKNVKLINSPPNSLSRNEKFFEGNVQSNNLLQNDYLEFDKSRKYKVGFGNKLKQKPLREEMGSINLPDENLSPLKPPSSQMMGAEHLINKPGAPLYEKEKKVYDSSFGPRRVKRELSEELENSNREFKKDTGVKLKSDMQSSEVSDCNDLNDFHKQGNTQYLKNPNIKASVLEINGNGVQTLKLKRNVMNGKENIVSETKMTKDAVEKIDKDIPNHKYNAEIPDNLAHENHMISKPLNDFSDLGIKQTQDTTDIKQIDSTKSKQSDSVNDEMLNTELINQVNNKYSFSNIENNVKRDIHLDTGEKSWQTEENFEKPNSNIKLESTNHKGVDNADIKSVMVNDGSSVYKKYENTLEKIGKQESEPSQTSKAQTCNTGNDDAIMVSALESVVKEMDKTKVKKDVLGGFAHPPLEGNNPEMQPIYSRAPLKYIKLDEIPTKSSSDSEERDGNSRTIEIGSKSGSGLIKGSSVPVEEIEEPIQAAKGYSEKQNPNQNQVDEIIIRIKTPEGTISEVKQNNYEIDGDGLRNKNIEPAVNIPNIVTGESVLGTENNRILTKNNIKTNDAEKSKRGVNIKSEEIEKKPSNYDEIKNDKGFSPQDFNIIVEPTQQGGVENEGCANNKAKRDDNTIHLVIETEPEVKTPESHNSESSGSNLFCQGRNCLEIKPVLLNDTRAAMTSNNTNNENPKEKIVEKRDVGDDESCGTTTAEPPLRCHDFNHRMFNLELMITVDYKVVKMHEDDDIENFILTIVNMVSSNFDDKSIGLNLNIILVRLILLTTCIKELDSDRFDPEELLENFCTWQVLVNPGRDDHPHHHDLAIFISRMDKCQGQVMGVSYMTSVCRPDKACIICIDEGLLLANTITHQIGHSLGADHDDGQNSQCGPKMPDGTTYHMSPTITETSSAWSVCSRDAIIHFVQTQGSWCLIDFPVIREYNFPVMLPGQIYSAAQQCKLNFHMTAIPCSIGPFCNKLYCQITDKLCATKGDPPADGTFCASNMWCFHKQCVHVGRRPGAINGEWGPWTDWSLCTRSCGGGVSSSYRICNNPKPENGGRYCIGERLRHRICQTTPCQGFTESFRDLQCKRTEDRPFRGKLHNWVQYQSLFINIECALVCQNRKGDVVMRSPIVADGTPCKAGTQNVCIQGTCRSVGCDFVIDSTAKEDACGICHGNGTECRIIQGVFDEAIVKKGLIEFLRIPKDSGMIFVRETAPSSNLLVVSGSINRVFYLNGLGSESSMAGDVAFGLAHGVYEKRGGMERVFIRGPTREDLIFYVLFREVNKGIHYQYATLEYDPTYIPRYLWQYLDWDACSDPCSGGSQRARAKCVEDRGGVVDDKYCTESTRPIDIVRPCNDFPCQAKWWVSVWSDCICTGATSVMFRSVLCMRANDESGTRVEVVKESECSLAKKPPTQKPCNYSETDTDCMKRSISEDFQFRANRDLRRAVNPRLAFSAFSPVDSSSQETQLLPEQSVDDFSKEGPNKSKNLKKSKPQAVKINSKVVPNKLANQKLSDNELLDKKRVRAGKALESDNLKTIDPSKVDSSGVVKPNVNLDDAPTMQSKGRQVAKLNQKNSETMTDLLKPVASKESADESDSGTKDNEVKGANDNCETTNASTCPTEEETTETPTTCKQTCPPQPHKKTTCCKTTPHKQILVKTTMETTTIRPVAVKMDELDVNNFALTVVPLEYSGKRKLLPQSDPEFMHLGSLGQFGIADEQNATIISGQEALDLLEFARSNASEEPVILHEDMHN